MTFSSWISEIFEQPLRRGGLTSWPALFPDFSPLHSHLRRHLPSVVCATAVSEGQNLYQRTQKGFEMIFVTPGTIYRVRPSLFTCASSGVETQGVHLTAEGLCSCSILFLYCGVYSS